MRLNITASQSPTPEPKAQGPIPQGILSEKRSITPVSLVSVHTPCSPSLWPSIFILGAWPGFKSPNPADSCSAHPCHSSQGRKEVSPQFCHLLGLSSESSCQLCHDSRYMATLSWEPTPGHDSRYMATLSWGPTPGLTDYSQLPNYDGWELCCSQAPSVFLWPWGSWDHTVPPRILPCFTTWAPFRQGCPSPEQISKSSDFVLCCYITFWCHLTEAPFLHALSSQISLRIHFTTSPHLYFAESGCFSIFRIAAILFLDLWLSSQVLRMIW